MEKKLGEIYGGGSGRTDTPLGTGRGRDDVVKEGNLLAQIGGLFGAGQAAATSPNDDEVVVETVTCWKARWRNGKCIMTLGIDSRTGRTPQPSRNVDGLCASRGGPELTSNDGGEGEESVWRENRFSQSFLLKIAGTAVKSIGKVRQYSLAIDEMYLATKLVC